MLFSSKRVKNLIIGTNWPYCSSDGGFRYFSIELTKLI